MWCPSPSSPVSLVRHNIAIDFPFLPSYLPSFLPFFLSSFLSSFACCPLIRCSLSSHAGVGKNYQYLWYRIVFDYPIKARTLLHFGVSSFCPQNIKLNHAFFKKMLTDTHTHTHTHTHLQTGRRLANNRVRQRRCCWQPHGRLRWLLL